MAKSWALHNIITGDATMQRGRMDISFEDGSVVELGSPTLNVAQNIEKASVEPQGSNPYSAGWGSPFADLLGEKMAPEERGREVGTGMRIMIDSMAIEEARVSRNVPLDPAETIVGLLSAKVTVSLDTMNVEAAIRVGTGAVVTARPSVPT